MNRFQSIIAKATVLSLVIGLVGVVRPAQAAAVTSANDTMSRVQVSTLSNHELRFTTPTGVAASATVILTFSSGFSVAAGLDYEDLDFSYEGTPDGNCADNTDMTLAAAPSGTDMGAVRTSSTVITFTNGSTAVAAGSEVCVQIGTNATAGSTGVEQVTNNSSTSSNTLSLSGTFGDTGTIVIALVDDDTVAISASVTATLTFDIDTATTDTESAGPYSVSLGTITTTDTRVSGTSDSVNYIWVDLDTNATGGAVVTVQNANGSSGLVSSSVPADDIDNAAGVVGDGTENYGLCVVATAQTSGTLDDEGSYNGDTCAADTETNAVAALTTTAGNIFDTNGLPVVAGRGQIAVGASITSIQPAHTDYTDTVTLIATGTF